LECSIFKTLTIHVPFYYHYVDDIIIVVPNEYINTILSSFNSYHQERIKFTIEYGDNGVINFLDVKLLIENGRIIFDNYRKPTNSGRYLNYFSNHPVKHKRGVVIGQLDRILFLFHLIFHENNIISLINILQNNEYPSEFYLKLLTIGCQGHVIKVLSSKSNFENINREKKILPTRIPPELLKNILPFCISI